MIYAHYRTLQDHRYLSSLRREVVSAESDPVLSQVHNYYIMLLGE